MLDQRLIFAHRPSGIGCHCYHSIISTIFVDLESDTFYDVYLDKSAKETGQMNIAVGTGSRVARLLNFYRPVHAFLSQQCIDFVLSIHLSKPASSSQSPCQNLRMQTFFYL